MSGYQSDQQGANRQGLMTHRGTFDATGFPEFPPGIEGDVYTIAGDGIIGDGDESSGLEVGDREVLYCVRDNDGGLLIDPGVQEGWNVIRVQAARASTRQPGIARFANEEERQDDEVEEALILSSLDVLALLSEFRYLFRTLSEVVAPTDPTTEEVQLPGQYLLPARTIGRLDGLRIVVIGRFQHSSPSLQEPADKTFRLYLGEQVLLTNRVASNPVGDFMAEVVLYNAASNRQNGHSLLRTSGMPDQFEALQVTGLNWEVENLLIRMTIQTAEPGQQQLVERVAWSVERVR